MGEVGYDGIPVILVEGYVPDVGVAVVGRASRLQVVRPSPAIGIHGPTLDR